jgi:protoporphyrinogen oxidase
LTKKSAVFIGAGLANMLVALDLVVRLRARGEEIAIRFVEAGQTAGGLYTSHTNSDGGVFDHGMHIYYETLDPEIDELWESLLSPSEWVHLRDNLKDVAGIFYRGRLQKNSPYIDLRHIAPASRLRALIGLCHAILLNPKVDRRPSVNEITVDDYLNKRFGRTITQNYFREIFEKFFRTDLTKLSSLASQLVAFNRVVLLPSCLMRLLVRVPVIASRIAFPDQLVLPVVRATRECGLYPSKIGIGEVTRVLKARLDSIGAEFSFGTKLTKLNMRGGGLESIEVQSESGPKEEIETADRFVFWGAGLAPLLRVLENSEASDINHLVQVTKSVDSRGHWLVDFWICQPNSLSPLYYFYCFDPKLFTFRVTNYIAYCPTATMNGWDQITVEIWAPSEFSDEEVVALAIDELCTMKVISSDRDVKFSGIHQQQSKFPVLTVDEVQQIREISKKVSAKCHQNFRLLGSACDPEIFFLKDVIVHTKKMVQELYGE